MTVSKIMTHTAGKFVFSSRFSEAKIAPLIDRFELLHEIVQELPILPSVAARLEADMIRKSIFSTAAIEGNPLREKEVDAVINDQTEVINAHELEIRNLRAAYDFIKTASGTPFFLSEDFIKEIHFVVTRNIPTDTIGPGCYRNHLVRVGGRAHGGVYTPPKCLPDIQKLMRAYVDWLNSDSILALPPIVRAAIAHYYLGAIHPFGDGNGRTARIVEATILLRSGIEFVPIMLSDFYYRNLDKYFRAFSETRKRLRKSQDITAFVEFVVRGGIEALQESKDTIISAIRKLMLRHFFDSLLEARAIVRRQHALLGILLEKPSGFSFAYSDLYRDPSLRALYLNVSDRTAKRDLAKLRDHALITKKGSKYQLNWELLDLSSKPGRRFEPPKRAESPIL